MDFTDKYISVADKAIDLKSEKVVLSNDAFAIGEMIQELINSIKQVGHSLS